MMRELLDEKLARFELLERQLSDPAVLADSQKMAAVAREHGSLNKLASKYRRFRALNRQIVEAQEMVEGDDPRDGGTGRNRIARRSSRIAKNCGTNCST